MKWLILFLTRKRLGLRKNQSFRFKNQKSATEYYWFTSDAVMKMCYDGEVKPSSVSLNWLLSGDCVIVTDVA
jgi:hypothetical protein